MLDLSIMYFHNRKLLANTKQNTYTIVAFSTQTEYLFIHSIGTQRYNLVN